MYHIFVITSKRITTWKPLYSLLLSSFQFWLRYVHKKGWCLGASGYDVKIYHQTPENNVGVYGYRSCFSTRSFFWRRLVKLQHLCQHAPTIQCHVTKHKRHCKPRKSDKRRHYLRQYIRWVSAVLPWTKKKAAMGDLRTTTTSSCHTKYHIYCSFLYLLLSSIISKYLFSFRVFPEIRSTQFGNVGIICLPRG